MHNAPVFHLEVSQGVRASRRLSHYPFETIRNVGRTIRDSRKNQ